MPSTRRNRDRSRSPERDAPLPDGVPPISESDYFVKNTEFRVWLKDEKDKYFDELSSEKARSYFRKFVRAWNKGRLSKGLYHDAAAMVGPAANQTKYKWSFATKGSGVDDNALRAAREQVDLATYHLSGSAGGRVIGPTLPSASDLVLAREAVLEHHASERDLKRKRDRAEAKERLEDTVGPKEVGREGMLEKKRARRENDRAFREKGDDGYEADESTLLGGGDSFRDQIARRDASRKRFEEKRGATREDKVAVARERAVALREKDKATMDMFQQLAKQRFG
ncbi:hypothetical protein JVT61DRAFT_5011 [Boletus reticuloceps]|uniref:Uncharacterized protein n=1 Tax=Boletus reticuloceps TaxID=495285 RepID=A0A8I3AFN2_9AGAM|nr:hypothetical protein JVT61DRAFT_5011 [Boletus reticuloceps]